MNRNEIYEMPFTEYILAVEYAWIAFNMRRQDDIKNQKNKDKNKPFENVDWTGINPVEQALRRKIPDKVFEYVNK